MVHEVKVSDKALRHMESHVYYLSRINPSAAKKLRTQFLNDIKSLSDMPQKCPLYDRPWLIPGKYRYKLCANRFRLVFIIQDDVVWVDGVMDCYQDEEQWEW